MQHHDCEDSVAGSSSATISVRLPPALHLRSLSIEVLDFLLLLSHGCCRHPVDRTFACLLSPILCGVALWLARSSRAEFTNSRGLVALVTRGLLSSLLIIAKQFVVGEAVHGILLGCADWAMCCSLAIFCIPSCWVLPWIFMSELRHLPTFEKQCSALSVAHD
jgi:hypothetical protein